MHFDLSTWCPKKIFLQDFFFFKFSFLKDIKSITEIEYLSGKVKSIHLTLVGIFL